jgi:hypothetical protein
MYYCTHKVFESNVKSSQADFLYSSVLLKLTSCLLYSSLPLYSSRLLLQLESESYVTTDGQSASLSWYKAPIRGLRPDFFPFGIRNTSDNYVLHSVGRPLWREDGSVFCMCRWSLPAQSFSRPCPLGLVTVFYCLRFETSLFVASYDSQGHGGGIQPRLHTALLQLRNSVHLYRRGTDTELQKIHHVIAIQPVHWRSGWTYRKYISRDF